MNFDEFIKFLNQNNGLFSVIFSCFSVIFSAVVAIATVIYARLTKTLVSETIKMRVAQTEPDITTYIQPSGDRYLMLVVRNIGLGPAHDITFAVHPDIEYRPQKHISELSFVKNGLSYMAPGQELHYFVGLIPRGNKADDFQPFKVQVTFHNAAGNEIKKDYLINITELYDLLFTRDEELSALTRSVNGIANSLQHLAYGDRFSMPRFLVHIAKEMEKPSLTTRIKQMWKNSMQNLQSFLRKKEDKSG